MSTVKYRYEIAAQDRDPSPGASVRYRTDSGEGHRQTWGGALYANRQTVPWPADSLELESLIGGDEMNAMKLLGIVLLVGGILGLVYGGFTYTKDTHEAKIGPITLSVKDKETVNVPIWAGIGAIVIGGLLLVSGSKKS